MEKLKAHVLRRALGLPIIWHWACRYIIKHVAHTPVEATCLKCAAVNRQRLARHNPTMGTDRQMFCEKCGTRLSNKNWELACKGKPPVRRSFPEPQARRPVTIRTDWDV